MTFDPVKVDEFLELFHQNKERIRAFNGVEKLELYRDKDDDRIFFTYSIWKDVHSLEQYRRSDLFRAVWTSTRQLFTEKAQAWSVEKLVSI